MPAKFSIRKAPAGKFRFVLVGANGQPVVTSPPYDTKAAARNGVKAVQRAAASAAIEDETVPAAKKATKKPAKAGAKKASGKKSTAKRASKTGTAKTGTAKAGGKKATKRAGAKRAGGAGTGPRPAKKVTAPRASAR